jgi:hypothetical protein
VMPEPSVGDLGRVLADLERRSDSVNPSLSGNAVELAGIAQLAYQLHDRLDGAVVERMRLE